MAIGNKACYLLCIIKIACIYLKKQFIPSEVIDYVLDSIRNGYVDFNWNYYADDNNFYVNNPSKILEMITGKKWTVEKSNNIKYIAKEGEFIVSHFTLNGITGHFDMPQYNFYNYQFGKTTREGYIDSIRIFRCLEK